MECTIQDFVQIAADEAATIERVSGHARLATLANFRTLLRGQAERLVERLDLHVRLEAEGLDKPLAEPQTLDQAEQLACLACGLALYLGGDGYKQRLVADLLPRFDLAPIGQGARA